MKHDQGVGLRFSARRAFLAKTREMVANLVRFQLRARPYLTSPHANAAEKVKPVPAGSAHHTGGTSSNAFDEVWLY